MQNVYDGNGRNPDIGRRFTVSEDYGVVITAVGIEDGVCVPIYIAAHAGCDAVSDTVWEPYLDCGKAVEVCGGGGSHTVVSFPGTYSFGDPAEAELGLSESTNVVLRHHALSDIADMFAAKKSAAEPPFDVKVINDCDGPVMVELCPGSFGIETSLAQLGCITGSDGQQIGKVMLCKTVDEETRAETVKQVAYFEDGTVQDPYTGPWSVCAPDVCGPEPTLGVITDLTLLNT